MSRPASAAEAARSARELLARALPGSRRGTVRVHLARAAHLAEVIWTRWHVGPRQYQAKHLRWFLREATGDLAPSTRYDAWRTVRALAAALGRLDDWEPHLNGPWLRPSGDGQRPMQTGRPAKLPRGPARTTAEPPES